MPKKKLETDHFQDPEKVIETAEKEEVGKEIKPNTTSTDNIIDLRKRL